MSKACLAKMSHCCVVLSFVVLINLATVAQCACAAGEGERIHGLVWYRMDNGRERPVGCCYRDRKVLHNVQLVDNGFAFLCTYSPYNGTMFLPVACVQGGIHFLPGQDIAEGLLYYSCQRNSDFVIQKLITGCADDNGAKVEIGSVFPAAHFLYLCERAGSQVRARGIACLANGKAVNIGERFVKGDFELSCRQRGDVGIRIEAVGCFYDNRTFLPNERFFKGNIQFKCEIAHPDAVDQTSRHRAIGCYHDKTVYEPGAFWYLKERFKNTGYKMVCVRQEDDIRLEAQECYFDKHGKRLAVLPGVGFSVDGFVFVCEKNENSTLQIRYLRRQC